MLPDPVDRVDYLRKRWTARGVTAAATLYVAFMLAEMTARAASDIEMVHASAGFVLFVLGWTSVPIGFAVVGVWRRSYAARPVVLSVDATPAEAAGVPELDEPSGRHRGLSGDIAPPVRW